MSLSLTLKKVHPDGVYVVENFLTPYECDHFISKITEAEQSKSRKFVHGCDFYNNKEINPELAQFFWNRLETIVPSEFTDVKGKLWTKSKPSHFVASAHYKAGDQFDVHTDTGIVDDKDGTIKSKFTTLIYLNDNFEGGETQFFNDNFESTVTVTPKMGSLLLFDIDLWHSGLSIVEGDKYWIGVELMYCDTSEKNNKKRTLGSGGPLLGVVSTGAQDIYLSGNPQMSFWKKQYQRHTNSQVGPKYIQPRCTWNGKIHGKADFGSKTVFPFPRGGDMVKECYLSIKLPALDKHHRWVPYVGEALIKEIEIEIGGQRIDRHYGHFYHVNHKLCMTNEQQKVYYRQIGHLPELYNKVKGETHATNAGVVEWNESDSYNLMIPLRFWFNNDPGLALPIIALQYHEVKVNVAFEHAVNLIQCKSDSPCNCESDVCNQLPSRSFLSSNLVAEYVHLDKEEHDKMETVSHEYMIEQLQFTGQDTLTSKMNKIRLNFNHPVKELYFFCTKTPQKDLGAFRFAKALVNREWKTVTSKDRLSLLSEWNTNLRSKSAIEDLKDAKNVLEMNNLIEEATLKLNGNDWMPMMPEEYFTCVQQSQHHTNSDPNIYCYSFALNPEEHQPSQSLNFSQIDNASLVVKLKETPTSEEPVYFYVYAKNYSVFRIMSGMGGLAFSK